MNGTAESGNPEREPDLAEAFERLVGRQATSEEKANLFRVRDALGLRNNDALWLVLLALESYDARFRQYPQRIREELERGAKDLQAAMRAAGQEALAHARQVEPAADAGTRAASAWRTTLVACAGLVVFGAVCLTAGFNLAQAGRPAWLVSGGGVSPFGRVAGAVLRAPAGWMAFVLLLPALLAGARSGWRAGRDIGSRTVERLVGLAVLAGCALAGVAAIVILVGLL